MSDNEEIDPTFVDGMNDLFEIEDNSESKEDQPAEIEKPLVYNPKKPKWWKNISGNPTKAQKRAKNEVLKTHQLARPPHGILIDWDEVFPNKPDVWLEIGIGRGENLLSLAHRKKNENIALIGAEIHKPGLATACQRVLEGFGNNDYWTKYIPYSDELDPDGNKSTGDAHQERDNFELSNSSNQHNGEESPYDKVKFYPGDGMKLLPHIPTSSVAAVLVTFPDPFAHEREKQWRLVQPQTVKEIHRILRKSEPGYFFLATDHEGYNDWSQEVVESVNNELPLFEKQSPCSNRCHWLPAVSGYEQKGWDEGRRTMLSSWKALAKP